MKIFYLLFILVLPVNLYATDIASEVSKQVGYSWKNKVELTDYWLFVYLTDTGLNEKIYTLVIQTGVCILELEDIHPGLLEGVSKITIQGQHGKHLTFNGGSVECRELNSAGLGKAGDSYIKSKTNK